MSGIPECWAEVGSRSPHTWAAGPICNLGMEIPGRPVSEQLAGIIQEKEGMTLCMWGESVLEAGVSSTQNFSPQMGLTPCRQHRD